MNSLKVGDIYYSKEKIFKHFKNVITSEKLNFINKKTQDIPLDKVNKLLNKENYIWLNILEENEWRDKLKDEQYISIFRRVSKNLFQINKTDIKNIIDEIYFNNIKSCINDRTKLINLLKENGERFEYLPSNLKDKV